MTPNLHEVPIRASLCLRVIRIRQVGRILEALEKGGGLETAIVVFTAHHGDGARRRAVHSPGNGQRFTRAAKLPFRQKLAKPQELCFDWMPRVVDGDMSHDARESVP